ncbi:NAD(P)-dependent dehydrogenase, short-chain alcohol dehydrogenase family [Streptomyces sp. yr375]|uniref:SDR family NAD(P)-dependent oxidoreductase n=1 Tax=Streptomyces sp. yr375 TaxID=1761906 RepID=UPI0008CCA3FB|nr:SDR family oxidoreductase [Streptomyces sp. yr375]SEP64346.1 NAD(P)-dependent dehydrogenase, short-chain alcohol dehydrogenase family [Streptomyces sp. yr375]
MGQLEGRVAVVTGGSKGIGFASALRFAQEGAYVYLTGRGKEELDEAVARIGPRATGVRGDVTNLADLDRLFATVDADGRRIDVLFANAGGTTFGALADVTEEDYAYATGLNLRGSLFTVQKALPLLNDNASVVLATSTTGARGSAGVGLYAASKAAVRSLARTWANELKHRGIRVNALAPGATRTPALAAATPEGATPEEFRAMVAAPVPLGRVAEPEEQAAAALFLASDQSSYITGIELHVDGGINQI